MTDIEIERLLGILNLSDRLSQTEFARIAGLFTTRVFRIKEAFQNAGDPQRQIGIVDRGIFRAR